MSALTNPLTGQPITDQELSSVSEMVKMLMQLDEQIEKTEKSLSDLNATKLKYQTELIPASLEQMGLTQLRLTNGAEVTVDPFYAASISEENRPAAHDWLRKNGFAALIKREIKCLFGKGEDEKAAAILAQLRIQGANPVDKQSVHPQTLKAFVKEQITAGKALPTDLLGVFVGKRAKITPATK